jgi:hypothetical protein
MLLRREAFGEPRRHRDVVDLAQSVLQLFETAQEPLCLLGTIDRFQELDAVAKLLERLSQRVKLRRLRVCTNRSPPLRRLGVEAIEQLSGNVLDVPIQRLIADLAAVLAPLLYPGGESQHQSPEGRVLQLSHATLVRCGAARLGGRPHHFGEFSSLRSFGDLRQDLVAKDVPVAGLPDRPADVAKLVLEQPHRMGLDMRRKKPQR